MKLLPLVLSLFLVLPVIGQTNGPPTAQTSPTTDPTTITTTWGKEYDDVKIIKVDPDGIHITYPLGVAKIPFTQLSPELQKQYGYDPVAAKQFENEQNQTQAQIDAEEAPKIAAELANEKRQADSDEQQRLAKIATENAKIRAEAAQQEASNLKQQMKQDRNHGTDYGYSRDGNSGTYWNDKRENEQAELNDVNSQLNSANQQLHSADKGTNPATPKSYTNAPPQNYQQNPYQRTQPQYQPQVQQQVPPQGQPESSSTTTVITTTTTTRQVIVQPPTNQISPTH